jgi:hypothetical protein
MLNLSFVNRHRRSISVSRRWPINVSSWVTLRLVATFACLAVARIVSVAQVPVGPSAMQSRSDPRPALRSVLAVFSKYEVVGINAGHDDKDIDDFILALIRDPSFPGQVNDIAVECGNSLYQRVLDRYIAGELVSYTDVEKVWRNTTQPMCGHSAFYEQFFPLVRAINQALPARQRIRILAADPPVDWSLIHSQKDFSSFTDRDGRIASVMEKEVLSKHRKALMLFGIFHLLHGSGPGNGDAVTIYEKKYPGSTFVISDLGYFGADPKDASGVSIADWPNPSLIKTRKTSLGSLPLDSFLPTPISTDDQCNVIDPFRSRPNMIVADLIDAFLYLGPQNLRLKEKIPGDIALDDPYMSELLRRNAITGLPGPQSVAEFNQHTIASATSPLLKIERLPGAGEFYPMIRRLCLDRTKPATAK